MKNNFKRIISLIAVVIIMLTSIASTVFAATASDAKNGVVAVQSGSGIGTGFAIGKKGKPVEYVVTNNHVVNGEKNTTAKVYYNFAANKYVEAKVAYYNKQKDIAILKLPEATEERVPLVLCPKENLTVDDSYYALGYPGTSIEITEWLQFSPDDITVTQGGIKKEDTYEDVDVFYLDLTITYGNSGGPLVNSKGEVAGICRGAVNYQNQAIRIDELIRILNAENIPFEQHGAINMTMILCIAIAVLVILIVVIVIVIVTKKKQPVAVPPVVVPDGGVTQAKVEPVAPRVDRPVARVIANGGTLNGKRYAVSGSVKVGRDASRCAIAFPVNTQGVSGVHCEIAFDGAVCYVKDLNSSYGTYTPDGRKLAPNTPHILKSGDKFYLASPENTFEVTF